MKAQITQSAGGTRAMKAGLSAILMAVLAACANYAGIHSDQKMAQPRQFATMRSLPSESGHWPAADWADPFGDAQLKALLEQALKGSPTIAQARARVAGAQAYAQTAKASTMPRVDAEYSTAREQLSGTADVPPPYAGSWQTQNSGLLSASYDLDLWGKNRAALKAAISQLQASQADAEVVKLTLTTALARAYTELARLYVLRDIAQQEVKRREQIDRITAGRIAIGLDTGELRAQLKSRYADFDDAVATYDQTLIAALNGVATQLAQIRSSDVQLADAQAAQQAAREADDLAIVRYKGGLTNQLTVLNADMNTLQADQAVANLLMNRRDQQIALASALGGGYVDTSSDTSSDASRGADLAAPAHPIVAAR